MKLRHWGLETHIWIGNLTIFGSDNGLSPGQVQAIILTNVGKLLIWFLGTNFSENSIEILTFSFRKIRLKVSSAKWRPFCIGLNVLTHWSLGADTKMCQESQVNTMVAVVVVPWKTRVKTVTTLIKYRKIQVLAVHEDPESKGRGANMDPTWDR